MEPDDQVRSLHAERRFEKGRMPVGGQGVEHRMTRLSVWLTLARMQNACHIACFAARPEPGSRRN